MEISVTIFDLPEPQFDCPVTPINFCGCEVSLNAIDANPNTAIFLLRKGELQFAPADM